jgi:hypothetical protein
MAEETSRSTTADRQIPKKMLASIQKDEETQGAYS